jgi:hypothetical protein
LTIAGFQPIRLPVFIQDLETVRAIIHSFGLMHCPTLSVIDVCSVKPPAHQVLYSYLVHPDDFEVVKHEVEGIFAKRQALDVTAPKRAVLGMAAEAPDTTPPMSFK